MIVKFFFVYFQRHMQVIKEEELTVFVPRWEGRTSEEAEEDPGKKLNPATSKEVT